MFAIEQTSNLDSKYEEDDRRRCTFGCSMLLCEQYSRQLVETQTH